jgi:hypothetical protein
LSAQRVSKDLVARVDAAQNLSSIASPRLRSKKTPGKKPYETHPENVAVTAITESGAPRVHMRAMRHAQIGSPKMMIYQN